METVLIILAVLIALILVLIAIASRRPSEMQIARRASNNATPEAVYARVIDFRRWTEWSPWEGADPDLQRTYSGAEIGAGSVYAWSGNRKAGAGRMQITDASAPRSVDIQLDFTKPFKATNHVRIDIARTDRGSDLTWTMTGTNNIASKVMGLMVNMDKMIGADFERGLAKLGTEAEKDNGAAG